MESPSSEADFSVAKLVELLQAPDEHVRLFAAVRLVALGMEASPAVPCLTVLLASEVVLDRRIAAWVLGSIGPRAGAAIPALLEVLHDADEKVRKYVSEAIQKIGRRIRACQRRHERANSSFRQCGICLDRHFLHCLGPTTLFRRHIVEQPARRSISLEVRIQAKGMQPFQVAVWSICWRWFSDC